MDDREIDQVVTDDEILTLDTLELELILSHREASCGQLAWGLDEEAREAWEAWEAVARGRRQ